MHLKTMIALLVSSIGGIVVGGRIKPRPFKSSNWSSQDLGSVDLPTGLPAPVERYARTIFGSTIPIIESALVMGRAELTLNGITFNGRYKFYHQAGKAYYHTIELTWFGRPIIKVHERYMNGQAVMALPGGRIENDPKTNSAANQGLWAEAIWLPSIWFTDERVQWVAVDDTTARLIIPGAAEEEQFTLTFDPVTGLNKQIKTLRYRESKDAVRHRWTNTTLEWTDFKGVYVPARASTQWDDDKPWAVWHIDEVFYNVDVSGRFAVFGGEYMD
jgi:hypothetical protein